MKKSIEIIMLILALIMPMSAMDPGIPAGADVETPLRLATTYIRYVKPGVGVRAEGDITPLDAFNTICQVIGHHLPEGRVYHGHVTDGSAYGYSFTDKNQPPIEFVAGLLGSKKYRDTHMAIADVGCGLGLSAISFISMVVAREAPASPISFDLFDINPEHQDALQSLAKLANMAHPRHFRVTAGVHDAADPLPLNRYNFIFAFNFMHYVQETKWGSTLENMVGAMKKDGMLLMITDHWLSCVDHVDQKMALEESVRTVASPFFSAAVLVFDPRVGQEKGTHIKNLKLISFLKGGQEYIPGATCRYDQLDDEKFRELLSIHLAERCKRTVVLFLGTADREEIPAERVIELIANGTLVVQIGSYTFDDILLERAVRQFIPEDRLKKAPFNWTQHLIKNPRGYSSSVGITFIKQ